MGVGQVFFNQSPKDLSPQTNPLGGDTDSMMTDVKPTQNQRRRETPTNFAKKEPSENVAQQLPNTDPESTETNNWPNQEWNNADWDAWAYYWPLAMGYAENNTETQEEGKATRGETIRGVAKSIYT